jgi:hypothetical protein
MGGGTYSSSTRHERGASAGYFSKPKEEIFTQRSINNAMSPYGVVVRESRDSAEHPNSLAIILALDVTGSMGTIPHHLVKDGLPDIMQGIIDKGIKDPQLLFLGIGDYDAGDNAPLQVGQFESSDELLDKWLTDIWLEGRGGGNYGESYMLAWYFAAQHTAIDCFEKRKEKGFLFTIGDEPVLESISRRGLDEIMGPGQHENYTALQLLNKAQERYNVYHLHIKETNSGGRQEVMDGWKQLMADNLIIVNKHQDVSGIIADIVIKSAQKVEKPADMPNVDPEYKPSKKML